MKKIAIALALTASVALIACGEEAKKEEPKKEAAPAPAPAAEEKSPEELAKKEKFLAELKVAVETNCSLKLAALSGSQEDKDKSKAYHAEFREKFGQINQDKIKAAKAEIKACADLAAAKEAKKAAK